MNETLIFDALSDGVRRQILECLGERGECTVTEIATQITTVGRTTVSSHLRVLRTCGLVTERRSGRQRFYSLDREGSVGAAVGFLQRILDQAVIAEPDLDEADLPVDLSERRQTS